MSKARFTSGRQWAILIAALLILDALAVYASLNLAYAVRISSGLLAYGAPHDPIAYRCFALASTPAWLALFALFGLYRRDNLLGGLDEYRQVWRACTVGVIAIIVVSFLWRDGVQLSRGWLMLAWAFSCGLVEAERFLARRVGYFLRRRGWFTARVLIAGANDQGCAIARQWLHNPASGMVVVGFVDDFKPIAAPVVEDLRVLGRPSELDEIVRQTDAQEVVVVSTAVAWETFEEIVGRSPARNGYVVRFSPGFYETLASSVAVTNKTFVPLLTVDEARLVGLDATLKLLLDYGLGLPLALLAAPLMAAIALHLRLARHGPALEQFPTVGQHGAVFAMYKFRPEHFLVRSGLDKLPQLFNVLLGQMSLVGPRPRVIGTADDDPSTAYNFQTVKPGIIGPWIVSAPWASGHEAQDELYYVRNWTIWLDLQILVQTALGLLTSAFRPQARRGRRETTVRD
ncbi:MAG: sugar transferase [Anaerolineae bacterium]